MGRQRCFYMTEKEENEFIKYIQQFADIICLNEKGEIEKVNTFKSLKYVIYNKNWGTLCDLNKGGINSSKCPVIEISKTIIIPEINYLSSGRIWYENFFIDIGKCEKTYKSEEIAKVYYKLSDWLKKKLMYIKGYDFYVSRDMEYLLRDWYPFLFKYHDADKKT